MASTHLLPCSICTGTGKLSDGHPNDPYAGEYDCEACDGTGEQVCDGSCERDECAEVAPPYVLPGVMLCL